MIGKQKCKILKEIRQRIADENDIPYVTRECSYQGECKGTCPRCESELKYLEQELARRSSLGKCVSVAALCVGISLAAAGCSPTVGQNTNSVKTDDLAGAVDVASPTSEPDIIELDGEVAWPDVDSSYDSTDVDTFVTTGEVPWTDSECSSVDTVENT
ncbi:MAG: hypothetical protein Q4A32_04895 [Lachnospiraceae bacterium]|nr:hypothetical protein [Lachnospiraceae bacterium]